MKSRLIGILKDNFKLKYCRETIDTNKRKFDLLIPMVSFCDIPFSQILSHVENYGCYGIGLKKVWAEKNGLNPVLYVDKKSSLSENFFEHIYKMNVGEEKKITGLTLEEKYTYDIFRYLKNYQGDLKRAEKKIVKDYRFSDEREWRYVLPVQSEHMMFGQIPLTKSNEDEFIKKAKAYLNGKIESEKLYFEPEDINYIIIKNETERDDIIRTLENVKGKYPHEQIKRLTSRILSSQQIRSDF
jgi:hypothetical protein